MSVLTENQAIDLLLGAKWLKAPLVRDGRLGRRVAVIAVDQDGLPTGVRCGDIRGLVAFMEGWLNKAEPSGPEWRFRREEARS